MRPSFDNFERSISTAAPRKFASIALMFGLLALGMAGMAILNPPRFPAAFLSERFERSFQAFAVWGQVVFGAAFACSGAGLYFRRDWGRLGLQAALWVYLAASVASFPFIAWVWHEMLKQRVAPTDPTLWRIGLYCLLIVFGLLVLVAIFKALRRIIRELRSPRFKDWCRP